MGQEKWIGAGGELKVSGTDGTREMDWWWEVN
jgi:hypothetical protein